MREMKEYTANTTQEICRSTFTETEVQANRRSGVIASVPSGFELGWPSESQDTPRVLVPYSSYKGVRLKEVIKTCPGGAPFVP